MGLNRYKGKRGYEKLKTQSLLFYKTHHYPPRTRDVNYTAVCMLHQGEYEPYCQTRSWPEFLYHIGIQPDQNQFPKLSKIDWKYKSLSDIKNKVKSVVLEKNTTELSELYSQYSDVLCYKFAVSWYLILEEIIEELQSDGMMTNSILTSWQLTRTRQDGFWDSTVGEKFALTTCIEHMYTTNQLISTVTPQTHRILLQIRVTPGIWGCFSTYDFLQKCITRMGKDTRGIPSCINKQWQVYERIAKMKQHYGNMDKSDAVQLIRSYILSHDCEKLPTARSSGEIRMVYTRVSTCKYQDLWNVDGWGDLLGEVTLALAAELGSETLRDTFYEYKRRYIKPV